MEFMPTKIPDVLLLEPKVIADERGFFMESWHRRRFADAGLDVDFVQDNHSQSGKGTLRGLHYQLPQSQGKLVRVTVGEVFDVSVDIRRSSPTFGSWVGEYLSADNKRMLWIPTGFAHGFYVTSEVAEVQYKCTDYYAPEYEYCIRWDDPEIKIAWPIAEKESLNVSEKDRNGGSLRTVKLFD